MLLLLFYVILADVALSPLWIAIVCFTLYFSAYFGRDMVRDMHKLADAYKKANSLPKDATDEEKEAAQFDVADLEIFENLAWISMKHAGEDVGETPEEWLESLDGVFSIYEILPTLLEMWRMNNLTTSTPRKK